MLATAVTSLPRGEGWAFEFKWDGVRALLDVSEHGVSLHSRAGNDVTSAYPELVSQAQGVGDALLDGEIVAIADGRPSFELLQSRMHVRSAGEARRLALQAPVTFVVFDVLRRYGVDLTARPYSERRATLERWTADHDGWTLSPSFDDGAATEAAAREHGLEGVVAKRVTSRYRPGVRGPDWLKLRFVQSGEFVVVGWESAADRPGDLSSLVLAAHRPGNGGLVYAGKAGSGLTAQTSRRLQALLHTSDRCPLPGPPPVPSARVVTWVEPSVVVEVEYVEVTEDGRLRHPVFRGIRADKRAEEATGYA
ncbi:MAG: non-homologous end-joining DNA ligase [Actinomycetota bacterium]|nr:non-homologous end-joining DNA ligase [Actinomycetota bacterium]